MQDGRIMERKILIRDITIVCLVVLFILQAFWTVKRQSDLTYVEDRNSILNREIEHSDKRIRELESVIDSGTTRVSKLRQENDLMLADYNEILMVIRKYERDISNHPTISTDSFQSYFAEYKYNPPKIPMGGNKNGIREGKTESGVSVNTKRSPGTGGCD